MPGDADETPVERPPMRTSRAVMAWGIVEAWLARGTGRAVMFSVRRAGLYVDVYLAEDSAPVSELVNPVEDPLSAVLRAVGKAGP